MSAVHESPRRHRVSAEEFLRMAEAGVFDPEARLELIEGEIVEMAPIGQPHAAVVATLHELLVLQLSKRAFVWSQSGLVLSEWSVPQPDLAVLARRADNYRNANVTPGDVLLAIEVADTSFAFDKGRKAQLYASHGVRELWVVDVRGERVLVFRNPRAVGYALLDTYSGNDELHALALPDLRLTVAQIFPR